MTNNRTKLTTHNSQLTTPLLLVALSLALNLHDLAADGFWGDEIFTATFAGRSPTELIRWTANDIHPPLYYLLAGAFTRFTIPLGATGLPGPASDWLWRFPSVIAVVLTIAVTYRLARQVIPIKQDATRNKQYVIRNRHSKSQPITYNPQLTATSAALLLCLSPTVIKYGQEARMHTLFMFLSVLSTWLFFRALARPRRWTGWLAFALATTANLYTMYFGFLILVSQAGLLLFSIIDNRLSISQSRHTVLHRNIRVTLRGNAKRVGGKELGGHRSAERSRRSRRRITDHASRFIGFSTVLVFAFLGYLPWWPVLFNIVRQRAVVGAIEGGVGRPLNFIRGIVRALGPAPEPVAWGFLALFVIGLIFLLARRDRPLAAFAGLWLALPAVLPIFLGDPRALQFRYAFVLPVYLIVIAYAVVSLSAFQSSNLPLSLPANLPAYLIWLLATVSFIATLGIYNQTKPDWRGAAAYLDAHAAPADIILIGPLWDEGRFIGYYYRGPAQLLTPAAMVTNIQRRAENLRANGGRVWAVNRFAPAELPASRNVIFPGVVISEPQIAVYEPALLVEAAINLAAQAVDAAYPWTAEAEAQGVLNPDPRTAKAAALRAWGDALVAAGRPEEAIGPYQTAVDIFPGWVGGFIALAETQETVGNLAAAAEAYRQAVTFNLKWHGPQADEAARLVEADQFGAALEKYHQLIED